MFGCNGDSGSMLRRSRRGRSLALRRPMHFYDKNADFTKLCSGQPAAYCPTDLSPYILRNSNQMQVDYVKYDDCYHEQYTEPTRYPGDMPPILRYPLMVNTNDEGIQ